MFNSYINVLINSLPILITIALTVFLTHKKVLGEETKKGIAPLLFKVIIPFLIFKILYKLAIDQNDVIAVGFAILVGFVLVLCAAFYAKFRNWNKALTAAVVVQMLGYSVGSFAYPFVQLNFDQDIFGKVVIFDIAMFVMLIIMGPLIGSFYSNKDEEKALTKSLQQLAKDPVLLTVVLTLLLNFFKIEVPAPITNLATFVSSGFFFLVIVYLSISLRLPERSKFFQLCEMFIFRYGILVLSAFAFLFIFPEQRMLLKAYILTFFTPFSSFALAFSDKYSLDEDIIAQLAVFSLIAFIFIYPVIITFVGGL